MNPPATTPRAPRSPCPARTSASIALLALLLRAGAILPAEAADWPGPDWPVAAPEDEGMSSARLEAIKDRLAGKNTRAFLVARNDRLIFEWYAPGVTPSTRQGTASLAKALVGGMSLAVALTDGRIALDDPASKFVPQWRDDPLKSKITIRHLGSHTSGLADSTTENMAVKSEAQPGWMGEFWRRLDPPRDPFTLARDETPMLAAPGEKLQYSNPGLGMMAYCVTAALRGGPRPDLRSLLRERVLRPIGVADADWTAGYGQTFQVDGLPLVADWGGAAFTPRVASRVGRLVLHEGLWQGRRILSPEAVRQVTGDSGLTGHCGMGWWGNGGLRYPGLPRDAVWGAGAGDQLVFVVPSLNLIMVRNGQALAPGPGEPPVRDDDVFTKYHDYRARILLEPLVAAVENTPLSNPPPRGSFIKEVRWQPAETIRRSADGSDNWPLTWADDGALYGAYGDGNGFEPFTAEKLSLGFARIDGAPGDSQGRNIRAPSLEARGGGRVARKASGLLCVKGVFYLWARNTGNARLAWSADHGVNWTWADWKFTNGFGCPTFVNYGPDYAGNQDGFAYILSPDAGDAYTPADRFDLARVPVDRIRERVAYEFFQSRAASERAPSWTANPAVRGPVLERPGACYRPSVTFDAGLKRFLLVHPRPNALSRNAAGTIDVRFHGGLSIYEAPAPWGPWALAFDTADWDTGPGDSASFPSKWISPDGRTLTLVFSGQDSFALRQATLVPAPSKQP